MMRATRFEFRFRTLIIAAILTFGFWFHGLQGHGVWVTLSGVLAQRGILSFQNAALLIGYAAAAIAFFGALLRTIATAYLGAGVVHDRALHSDRVLADGPYRYMRNPLYIGAEMSFISAAFVMSVPSAIFVVVTTTILFLRIAAREEYELAPTPGYAAYARAVPRWMPSLRPRVAAGGARPRWGQALLGEVYPWGVALSFAIFVPHFNAVPIMQGIGVSFGVALILRGLGFNSLG